MLPVRSRSAQHEATIRTNTDHTVRRNVSAKKKRGEAIKSSILNCPKASRRVSPQII